jgi:Carboxypeptidase regulatory-like domain
MMKQRYVFAMAVLCSAISLRAVSSAMAAESAIAGFDQRSREELRALTGRVHGDQDRPIADAVVYLKNTKTLVVKTYITEANGTYRFPALSSNVDYEVHAEYKGGRSDTKTLSSFDSRKQAIINLKVNGNK